MKRVEIQWEDVYTAIGWHTPDVVPEPAVITQVGYVLRKTRKHLILVSSYDEEHVGDVTNIPLSLVRKMRRV